jgi:hypothetical protein
MPACLSRGVPPAPAWSRGLGRGRPQKSAAQRRGGAEIASAFGDGAGAGNGNGNGNAS